MLDKLLLILDLDETLVRATDLPLDRPPDARFEPYVVYERPFVRDFLQACSAEFHMAVWTSSSREYAEEIVEWLFQGIELEFMWARERCTQRLNPVTCEHYWIKDLKKVRKRGFQRERMLMVDDTPRKLERSYGNHIRVTPFEGDAHDDELPLLLTYLRRLADLPDVRPPEKRGWRGQLQSPER